MSQKNLTIPTHLSGPNFRSYITDIAQALASLSSGGSEPTDTYAYMLWIDTTNNKLKMRNAADNGWLTLINSLTLSDQTLAQLAAANIFTDSQKLRGDARLLRMYDTASAKEWAIRCDDGVFQVLYNNGTEGSPSWQVKFTVNTTGPVVPSVVVPVGSVLPFAGSTAPTGWLLSDGGTIGDASSGATARANADTVDLFTQLWNSFADAQLPVTPGGRGGSAAADFAAHKKIELPNMKGRVAVGYNASETEFDAMGEKSGAKTTTLGINNMPIHNHRMNYKAGDTGGEMGYLLKGGNSALGYQYSENNGSGEAHNNLQPYLTLNYIIKYSTT